MVAEAQLLLGLRASRSVVRLEGWGQEPGRGMVWLLMELADRSVEAAVAEVARGGLDAAVRVRRARELWRRLVEAVGALHARGVVHLDLKPSNFVEVGGEIKVIDFFSAHTAVPPSADAVEVWSFWGTMAYLTPEAASAVAAGVLPLPLGKFSDVWVLGCMLWQLMFGCLPLASNGVNLSDSSAVWRAARDPRRFPLRLPAHAPRDDDLEDVLLRCLDMDPRARPSCAALLEHPFLARAD
jgi:serine/threonine protein kinase